MFFVNLFSITISPLIFFPFFFISLMSSLFPVKYLGPPQGVLVEPNFSVSFICRFAFSELTSVLEN